MPLKLIPPRQGKTPYWSIRGTYLHVYVDRSCRTDRKAVARKIMREVVGKIERGEYLEKAQKPARFTFLSAAVAYMKAGGERGNMARLISHFGETPVDEIDQQRVNQAAIEILPAATPATRNRKVYTPVSAVLHHVGKDVSFRRPKGAKGEIRTTFMNPPDAMAIIEGADSFDFEFGTYLFYLLYTGARRNEPFQLQIGQIDWQRGIAIFGKTKNGNPRFMLLHNLLLDRLRRLKGDRTEGPIFTMRPGGGLKDKLLRAKLAAEGRDMPKRTKKGSRRQPAHRYSWVTFHVFRHTFATWMRAYGGADALGLVATGNWTDPRSAARYAHVVPRDEWDRVKKLPDMTRGVSVEAVEKHG